MNLAEGFSTGLNGLFANKLRSGLTILGIIIGVSAVIAMVSIGEGAKQAIIKRIESMGSNLLGVGIGKLMSKAMSGGTLSSVVSLSSIILSLLCRRHRHFLRYVSRQQSLKIRRLLRH